jgi:DNA transformation protein
MSISDAFRDFLVEHLGAFGPVSIRRMFGGGGIYHKGLMFGLVADDTVYLKVDAQTRPRFEAEGLEPFVYSSGNGKSVTMGYCRVPERCMDDAAEMADWARLAHGAALRAALRAAQKPKRRRAS